MTKQISEITQQQIEELESTVSDYVDEYYEPIAQGMRDASVSWAKENNFDPEDVDNIVTLDNFSIRDDERQIKMYALRIKSWRPEHRKQLLALLSD